MCELVISPDESIVVSMSFRGVAITNTIDVESLRDADCFAYNFDIASKLLRDKLKYLCRVTQKPDEAVRICQHQQVKEN